MIGSHRSPAFICSNPNHISYLLKESKKLSVCLRGHEYFNIISMQEGNNVNTGAVITAGICGTSLMTLYSYLLSEDKNKNFKEPKLLGILVERIFPRLNRRKSQLAGWLLHYAVGFVFCAAYAKLWKSKTPLMDHYGIVPGAASGLIAVAVWRSAIKLHPRPPRTNYKKFYGQLIPAHMIFAVTASAAYHLHKKLS